MRVCVRASECDIEPVADLEGRTEGILWEE